MRAISTKTAYLYIHDPVNAMIGSGAKTPSGRSQNRDFFGHPAVADVGGDMGAGRDMGGPEGDCGQKGRRELRRRYWEGRQRQVH